MENIFISDITIECVRHLKNITIPLSDGERKHLILTGKNGSGKTSVLEALSDYLNLRITSKEVANILRSLSSLLQDPKARRDEKNGCHKNRCEITVQLPGGITKRLL